MGGRMDTVVPARRDDLISERMLEKGAEHVIGHQRCPAGLKQQQGTRLD